MWTKKDFLAFHHVLCFLSFESTLGLRTVWCWAGRTEVVATYLLELFGGKQLPPVAGNKVDESSESESKCYHCML